MDELSKALVEVLKVEKIIRKITEDPILYFSENGGFTDEQHRIFKNLIDICGTVNIAGSEMLKKVADWQKYPDENKA